MQGHHLELGTLPLGFRLPFEPRPSFDLNDLLQIGGRTAAFCVGCQAGEQPTPLARLTELLK